MKYSKKIKNNEHKYYEVRFHLGSDHYKFWQIKNQNKEVINYYDPLKFQLRLFDCELVNKPNVAAKVLESQVRDVCGWIKCSKFEVIKNKNQNNKNLKMVVYDPKVKTYWHYENQENNIDGEKFNEMITVEKRAYCY